MVPELPWRLIALAVVLISILLAASLTFGGPKPPATLRQLLTYSRNGDIYVGDPATGETHRIVAGPEVDSEPALSPDGMTIAFGRGAKTPDRNLWVVKSDGSGPRVVWQPEPHERGGFRFAWTPDGNSLVVNHDGPTFRTPYFDGALSVVDISGSQPPRLITPPLPLVPGGGYGAMDRMFHPATGEIIAAPGDVAAPPIIIPPSDPRSLYVWDADLRSHRVLTPAGLDRFADQFTRYQPRYAVVSPAWSPDGSQIIFEVALLNASGNQFLGNFSFVMDANGTDVRQLGSTQTHGAEWSPDGSKIAVEQLNPLGFVVYDVASGLERGVGLPGPDGSVYFAGWTGDSRGLLIAEEGGEHSRIVDVQTGQVSEFPWAMDSVPSWRTVPTR